MGRPKLSHMHTILPFMRTCIASAVIAIPAATQSLAESEYKLAKQARDEGRDEACLLHIDRARRFLADEPKLDKKLLEAIDKYARTVDHRDVARSKAMRKAAGKLLKVCQQYIDKGWLEIAGPLLGEARRLDPTSAKATQQKLSKARNASAGTGALAEMFLEGELIWGTDDWKFAGDVLIAPAYDESKVLMIGDRRLRFDAPDRATSVEFRAEGPVDLRIVFAYRHIEDYCVLRLDTEGAGKGKVEIARYEAGKKTAIASETVDMPASADGWRRLGFQCDGESLHVDFGEKRVLKAPIPMSPMRGFLGLMLLGKSAENKPVSFRHLRMEGYE